MVYMPEVEKNLLSLKDYRIVGDAQINPHAAEVEAIVAKLCDELGIYLPYYNEYATMPAYLYPRASVDRLVPIYLLLNMLWYVDDVYDRDTVQEQQQDKLARQRVYINCIKILRNGHSPSEYHLLYPVFMEIHRRFRALASQGWLERFADAMMAHLRASVENAEAIMLGQTLDVATYMHVRELDSGMRPTAYMVEFAAGIELPEDVMGHPYVEQMTLRCSRVGSLTNDLFSYEKEVLRLDSYYNLVRVFMESHNLAFMEAVHESIMLLNGILDDFEQDAGQIPAAWDAKTRADVATYIRGLRDINIATWHWQYSTNRYRSPESPFPELRQLLPRQ
ncbi:MAG: terpene synthase family protein [Anaerolineae bacterium]|jgi:hypothetical protein|nr:terpene synthase family protein [Anaerolineae bacterium]